MLFWLVLISRFCSGRTKFANKTWKIGKHRQGWGWWELGVAGYANSPNGFSTSVSSFSSLKLLS